MTRPRAILTLKQKRLPPTRPDEDALDAPTQAAAPTGHLNKLESLIDRAGQAVDRNSRAPALPWQNIGKGLRAMFPDPAQRLLIEDYARAQGHSISASPSCGVAFRLLQVATMPSGALCAKCHAVPRRAANQSYCHKCHSEDVNTRRANKDHELQKRRAMMGGLVVE
jgi:hypothetical protein